MHKDVKQCADSGDIKGLRYIFVDSLDVDPTFEKYQEDFAYCQNVPGLFEVHVELLPFTSDENRWNNEYWEKLKLDLLKNFSLKRFQHMMLVAKVVHAEKIKRISLERQENSRAASGVKVIKEQVKQEEREQRRNIEIKTDSKTNRELQERQLEEARRKLEIENQENEKKEREQEERIRRRQAELEASRNQQKGENASSKKVLGIVLTAVIILIIIMLIVK